MSLWFSSLFLVIGLFLSSSALTPEECQPLVTPLSLADPQMMYGRINFILGYTDNDVYNAILKSTESSWLNVTQAVPGVVVMDQENKINGTCLASTVNITIEGNTASASLANVTSTFHLLPTCEGCLLFSINTTGRNLDKLLQKMHLDGNVGEAEISTRALYLMARGTTVTDSDVEHFKQQASCLGFSGEPDFHYDPKNEFCAEGESIRVSK